MRSTYTSHLILLDFMILIISDEGYNYEALHCAIFSHHLVTSSMLGPNILLTNLL
jgi:hypothetical protein